MKFPKADAGISRRVAVRIVEGSSRCTGSTSWSTSADRCAKPSHLSRFGRELHRWPPDLLPVDEPIAMVRYRGLSVTMS